MEQGYLNVLMSHKTYLYYEIWRVVSKKVPVLINGILKIL